MKKSKKLIAGIMAVSMCMTGVNFPYSASPVTVSAASADDKAVLKDYAVQVWELVNAERAVKGLAPLNLNDDLVEVSEIRAEELTEIFDHERPDGTMCNTALSDFGLSTKAYGENIAYTSQNYPDQPEEVMDGWLNSEGHRENILNENFTEIGIGVAFANGKYYWIQTFTGELKKVSTETVWNVSDDGTLTINGVGYMQNYGFSENYAPWYSERENIKKIVITNGVKSLGDYAFAGFDRVTDIELPETLTRIGKGTFEGCRKLNNINIPSGVKQINDYAFSFCESLPSVKLPDGLQTIGSNTFDNCTSLAEINIPDSVAGIGNSAFSNCKTLISVTIPDSASSLGNALFYGCEALESITLPVNMTVIGEDMFYRCSSLKSITIPDSVSEIENLAFGYCESLESIVIPENVSYIRASVFRSCTSLQSVKIMNPDCSISSDAETISDTATIYGYEGSTAQTYAEKYGRNFISLDDGAFKWTIADGVLTVSGKGEMPDYADYTSAPWKDSGDSITEVVIKNGITSIGNHTFDFCDSLKKITIPDSVSKIGEKAFTGCTGLTSVTIPDGVSSIGSDAFGGCTSLASITIPESVTDIGESVFVDTPWLESKQAENPLVIVNNILIDGTTCSGNVSVPDGVTKICGRAFHAAGITGITIPDSVSSIGEYAFYYCKNLKSVIIPDGVTVINMYAFYYCTGLESVKISESVSRIDDSVFYGCENLSEISVLNPECEIYDFEYTLGGDAAIYGYKDSTAQAYAEKYSKQFIELDVNDTIKWNLSDGVLTITGEGDMQNYDVRYTGLNYSPWYANESIKEVIIGDGITSIGNCSFTHCENLTSVTIPDSVTKIGEYAFGVCGLTEVNIPESVEIIGAMAFSNCTNLKKINIPEKITAINHDVFWECKELTEIKLPENLESIGTAAFSGCDKLKEVSVPASVRTIDNIAFRCTGLESVTVLNPDCEIYDYDDAIISTATIYGYEGSTAQAYAEKYGNKFVVIGSEEDHTLKGDANVDGEVSISDAVLIMQALVNGDEYRLTAQGAVNADVYATGDGVTTQDALQIQMLIAGIIEKF